MSGHHRHHLPRGALTIVALLGVLTSIAAALTRQGPAAGSTRVVLSGPQSDGDRSRGASGGVPVLERLSLREVGDDALRQAIHRSADLINLSRTREVLEVLASVPRDRLDASDMSYLARLISLVDGAERFESCLRADLNREPGRVSGVGVVLIEPAARGSDPEELEAVIRGVKASGLDVDLDGGKRVIPIDALVPASQVALARRYHANAEEALWGAAYSLVHGLDDGFDRYLRKAATDAGLKGAVDSLLAFDRGVHPVPPGGFVRDGGHWVAARAVGQQPGGASDGGEIESLLEDLRSSSPVTRASARVALRQQAEENRDVVIETVRRLMQQRLDRVADSPTWRAVQQAYGQREEVESRRRHALDLIFDTEKYFYPFNPPACPTEKARLYPAVQREVDARVRSLREIWGREQGNPTVLARVPPSFWDEVENLLALRSTIDEFELGRHIPPSQVELRSRWLPRGETLITVRNLALSDQERTRLDHDREVEQLNAKLRDSVPQSTWGELAITNAYRQMLGRRALILDATLVQSARAHGKWMSRTGRFTHLADDSVGRTPFERMKRAGWKGLGGGENIAFNAGSPLKAHDMWIHSSGHHRNILWESHSHLGVAQVGRYWTQNFGGTSPYQGNLTDAGEGLFERN